MAIGDFRQFLTPEVMGAGERILGQKADFKITPTSEWALRDKLGREDTARKSLLDALNQPIEASDLEKQEAREKAKEILIKQEKANHEKAMKDQAIKYVDDYEAKYGKNMGPTYDREKAIQLAYDKNYKEYDETYVDEDKLNFLTDKLIQQKLDPRRLQQKRDIAQVQVDISDYLDQDKDGKSSKKSVWQMKQEARISQEEAFNDIIRIADEANRRVKENPESDLSDLYSDLAKARTKIYQATGTAPALSELTKRFNIPSQSKKERIEQEEHIDKIYDEAIDSYKGLGLDKLEESNRRFGMAQSLYADAKSGKSQAAQQQFLTNILKISDASQVLLSEAEANRAQDISTKVRGFLQSITLGSKIPSEDIDNIMRVGQSLQSQNLAAANAKANAIRNEFNRKAERYENIEPISSNEELYEKIIGMRLFNTGEKVGLQEGSFYTEEQKEKKKDNRPRRIKKRMGGF